MAFQKILRLVVAGVGALLLVSFAQAGAISDATIWNSTGGLDNSIANLQGQGKFETANLNTFTGRFAGDGWRLLDWTNKASKPFNDVYYVPSADTSQPSGEWGLSGAGVDVPQYLYYVLILKSGKQWEAYLFESFSRTPDLQDLGGTFSISWLKKDGKAAKLRHAGIFGPTGVAPDGFNDETEIAGDGPVYPGGPGGTNDGADDTRPTIADLAAHDVPTPGTLTLLAMGLGLILLQLRQRRKRRD